MRAEPRDDAEQVTQLLKGEPFDVLERQGGWARIETAYSYPGWVREETVGPPFGGLWPPGGSGDVLAEARAYLGSPYEWGGMTERGIDCSGLVHMAYRRAGVLVPRDSDQQDAAGVEVAGDELRAGDLCCYEGHIAFWLGDGRILHSTQRDGVDGVIEEFEPAALRARFRRSVRLV